MPEVSVDIRDVFSSPLKEVEPSPRTNMLKRSTIRKEMPKAVAMVNGLAASDWTAMKTGHPRTGLYGKPLMPQMARHRIVVP
jgi:hypothetical protein